MVRVIVNTIVKPTTLSAFAEQPFRVLDISHDRKQAIVITCEPKLKKPWIVPMSAIEAELDSNACFVAVEQTPQFLLRPDDEISSKEKYSRERRWSIISELVSSYTISELLTEDSFGAIISKHAKTKKVDRKQVYRLLFRYWALGQIKNALLTDTTNIGRSPSRRITQPQGRKPKYLGISHNDNPIVLTPTDLNFIRLAYDRLLDKKHGTLKHAHDWMVDKLYSKLLPDGTRGDINRGTFPTLGQFAYQGKKLNDELYQLKKQKGRTRYNKDARPLVGTAIDGLSGPCHRYEIDSTVADIYLVHRVNRNWLIGRPILYVVVDAFTRMIVGIHVGLEGPSWNGARHALYNAFTSKKDYCAKYKIEIEEEDWPCHHIPAEVSADRAELLSNSGENLANVLGVTIKIAPPYRPDWKAIVESRFRLLNEEIDIKFLPGGVNARRQERGDRSYELDAIFDLEQFTQMVILAVLNHNKSLRLPHLLTPAMYKDDLKATPINLWNWGFEHSVLNAKTRSASELKIALLPSCDVPIKRGGIYFKGLLFTCALAVNQGWLAVSHSMKTRYIRIWYDPNAVDNVWIKIGDAFERLSLVPNLANKFQGLRLDEVEDILAITLPPSPNEKFEAQKRRIDANRFQEVLTHEAKELMRAEPDITQTAFKRNIKDKRKADNAIDSARETLLLSDMHKPASTAGASQPQPVEASSPPSRGKKFLTLVQENAQDED